MNIISLSKWTDWSVVKQAATASGGSEIDCSWVGVDSDNPDNLILQLNETKIDLEIFKSFFTTQNVEELKKTSNLQNTIAKRAAEYPPITDYLDGVVKGDQAQIDKYIADCQAVKAKYPKGS
jgi:hypothetical protein